jgi:hypothetical protein
LVLPIIAYTLSSTKLDIRAKQFLLRSEGVEGERKAGGERRGRRKGGEMTQTWCAHMNKRNKILK